MNKKFIYLWSNAMSVLKKNFLALQFLTPRLLCSNKLILIIYLLVLIFTLIFPFFIWTFFFYSDLFFTNSLIAIFQIIITALIFVALYVLRSDKFNFSNNKFIKFIKFRKKIIIFSGLLFLFICSIFYPILKDISIFNTIFFEKSSEWGAIVNNKMFSLWGADENNKIFSLNLI